MSPEGILDKMGQRITVREAIIAADGISDGEEVLANWKDGEVLGPTRYYVITEVNKKLAGQVNPTILAFGEDRLVFQPSGLLAALYTLFAMEISGEQGEQRIACPQCGKEFVLTRKGQRFCSTECRALAGYHRTQKKKKQERVG